MSAIFYSFARPGGGEVRSARKRGFARRLRYVTILSMLALAGDPGAVFCQSAARRPVRRTQSRPTLIILGGVAQPLSHESVTDFWLRGPAASIAFTIDVQRYLALGLELSGAQFYFDKKAFGTRYPGVPIEAQNAGTIDAFLTMKLMLAPRMIFSPYLTASLGATHWTGASYKEEVPGQPRKVYYDIPRKTRLAGALTLGADIVISRWFAFVVEARTSYVYNDPELGLTGALRGGARFRL